MPGQPDNQNAKKPEGEAATSFIHAAVTPGDKGIFKAAAEDWAKAHKVSDKRGVFTMWLLSALHGAVPKHIRERISSKPDRAVHGKERNYADTEQTSPDARRNRRSVE